jgi:hypothetical protein
MIPEVKDLIQSSLRDVLRLPLRPIWALHDADGSIEWLGDLAEDFVCSHSDNDISPLAYTPIVLFSCSSDTSEAVQAEKHSWFYIKGAGDDEENWSRGLTPELFWKQRDALLCIEDNLLFEQEVDRIVASSLVRSIAHAGDAASCGGALGNDKGSVMTSIDGSAVHSSRDSQVVAVLDTGLHLALALTSPIEELVNHYDGVILLELLLSDASVPLLPTEGGEGLYCRITIPDNTAKTHTTSNRWIETVITSCLRYYGSVAKRCSPPPRVLIASRVDKCVAISVALAILTAFFGSRSDAAISIDGSASTIGCVYESPCSSSRWVFQRQSSRCISKSEIKLKLMALQSCFSNNLVLPRYVTKDINTYFLSPSKAPAGQAVIYGQSATLWDAIGI